MSVFVGAIVAFCVFGAAAVVLRMRPRPPAPKDTSELREGELVTIFGALRPAADLVEAPLTGIACVGYCAAVRGVDKHKRRASLGDTKLAPCSVELGGTRYAIEPGHVDIRTPLLPVIADIERVQQLAARLDLAFPEEPHEARLLPGTLVVVTGRLVLERAAPAGEAGYREEVVRGRLVGTAAEPITIALR